MLSFRPHHLLVALGFDEEGPSRAFLDNCQTLKAHLEGPRGQQVPIQVTMGVDALCRSCPGRHGRMCDHEEAMAALDPLYESLLGIKDGDVLPWGEIRRRLVAHIGDERWDEIVSQCPWQEYGAAKAAVEGIRAEARQMTTTITRIPTVKS